MITATRDGGDWRSGTATAAASTIIRKQYIMTKFTRKVDLSYNGLLAEVGTGFTKPVKIGRFPREPV